MFEKEADFRLARKESKAQITKAIKVWSAREEAVHDEAFKKGAEFGYNKANEWHYPSKGELPECDENTLLAFYANCYYEICGEVIKQKRMLLGFYRKAFLDDAVKLFVEKSKGYEAEHLTKEVIAWKKINLPIEKES